jgi:hypothetical protein
MIFFDRTSSSNRRRLLLPVAAILALTLAMQGCSYVTSFTNWWNGTDTDLDDAASGEGEPLPPPVANVAVSYKRPGDALARATVIKYFGADVIANHQRDAAHTESVVRFDGGVPIWEFKADESAFGSVTGVGAARYAIKDLQYSKVPPHFSQIIPDEGPPEPLDRGAYYVFQIERQSGSRSYQAVKVQADGSLQAYNAQPRAGSSYLLCCNVTANFPEPVILPEANPDAGTENAPSEEPPDEHGGGSSDAGTDPGAGPP